MMDTKSAVDATHVLIAQSLNDDALRRDLKEAERHQATAQVNLDYWSGRYTALLSEAARRGIPFAELGLPVRRCAIVER